MSWHFSGSRHIAATTTEKINFLTLVFYLLLQTVFLAKTYHFATIQNITDRQQTDDTLCLLTVLTLVDSLQTPVYCHNSHFRCFCDGISCHKRFILFEWSLQCFDAVGWVAGKASGMRNKKAANAKLNARQHCVSLSCLCNSLTQIEWVVQLLLPPKHAKSRKILIEFDLTAVQGHPRSSILVSIESPYVTSY